MHFYPRTAAIVIAASILCTGCASLQIKVYSYIGDETYGGDAQLAEAAGAAAHANQTARELSTRLNSQTGKKYLTRWKDLSGPLNDLVASYEGTEKIDSQTAALDSARFDPAAYSAARRQLAISLTRYGQRCISLGQRIGVPVENLFLWPFFEQDQELVTAAVGLENTGLKIQRLAANVLDGGDYTPLTSIFKSLQGGVVQAKIDPQAPDYKAIVNNSNWQLEDIQSFGGSGNLNDVVVKDEVGNWVEKSFSNDPTGIINATFDGTTLVVNTLAAAYGVSLPKTTGNTTANPTSTSGSGDDVGVQSQHAKNIAAQLKRLQSQEATSLQQILTTGKHDAPEQQAILTSIQFYQSQINALNISTTSSTSTTPAINTSSGTTSSETGSASK